MNVGMYVRVSTEEQRDFGYSIDAQIREINDYCERRNLKIIDIYNDAGHSAKDLNRPEMERMIKDIKNGKINCVISMKVDRLTREGYDGQWFLRFCKEYDCALIFLQENYDINTPEGEMGYGLSLLFGQRERRLISQRTTNAFEEAIKQGKYPNRAPMGYTKNSDKKLEVDLVEAEIVKEVFELYASGKNATEVGTIMKNNNRYLKNNGIWNATKVSRIISNPIYIGTLSWGRYHRKDGKETIIENHSPAIISKELWDKCQKQYDKYKHGNYGKNIHIFHRIIKCPECNNLMNSYYTVKHQNKHLKYNYYVRCKNKSCKKYGVSYSANKIEKELVGLLNDLSSLAIINKYCINYPKIDNKKELDSIKGTITKLKNSENKLLELLLSNELDQDTIISKMNTITAERKNLEKKKDKLESGPSIKYNKDLETLYEQKSIDDIKGINPIWNLLNREAKKDLISDMIDSIVISVDEKHNVTIDHIDFNNNFLQNQFFNISNYILNKVKNIYKTIKLIGVFTENQFKSIYGNNYNSYSELMKNYTQDKKSLEIILNKYKDNNLELYLITDNNKYKDVYIKFNS